MSKHFFADEEEEDTLGRNRIGGGSKVLHLSIDSTDRHHHDLPERTNFYTSRRMTDQHIIEPLFQKSLRKGMVIGGGSPPPV